jgi:hypothetical protein
MSQLHHSLSPLHCFFCYSSFQLTVSFVSTCWAVYYCSRCYCCVDPAFKWRLGLTASSRDDGRGNGAAGVLCRKVRGQRKVCFVSIVRVVWTCDREVSLECFEVLSQLFVKSFVVADVELEGQLQPSLQPASVESGKRDSLRDPKGLCTGIS